MPNKPEFETRDPAFREKVRISFHRQEVMKTIGVEIVSIDPGKVELAFLHQNTLTQQHGYIHAGIVTTALDSACGYAALSLMPENSEVLTIEFKSNLLAPAMGDSYLAIGRVKKSGRTITVSDGELYAISGQAEKLAATMTATLMLVNG